MNKPHKYAELIRKWADGETIQGRDTSTSDWRDLTTPHWHLDCEYRIKPEPKPDLVKYMRFENFCAVNYSSESICANVRFVFDGETGKLKHVELLEQKS